MSRSKKGKELKPGYGFPDEILDAKNLDEFVTEVLDVRLLSVLLPCKSQRACKYVGRGPEKD